MRTAIMVILAIAIAFGLGYVIGKYIAKQDVVIKEVKVTETKYIKVPVTLQEYKDCYESPIRIQATATENIIRVRAFDDCKEATADITVEARNQNSLLYIVASFATGLIFGVLLPIML